MKRFDHFILGCVGALLLLSACVSSDRPQTGVTIPSTIGTTIGVIGGELLDQHAPDLSSAVRNSCGWLITAADFAGLTGRMPSVDEAAQAICDALKTRTVVARASSTKRGSRPPTEVVYLNGVKLTVQYIGR